MNISLRVRILYELFFYRYYRYVDLHCMQNVSDLMINNWSTELFYVESQSKGSRSIVLRPEFTNIVVSRLRSTALQKLFYTGVCFRKESRQKNRYNEFIQLGVESFQMNEKYVDNCYTDTILYLLYLTKFLSMLSKDIVIRWNYIPDRKLMENYFVEHGINDFHALLRLIDKKLLPEQDMRFAVYSSMLFSSPSIYENLPCSINGLRLQKDISIIRGLDYYRGFIFELDFQNLIVGGGGEYMFVDRSLSVSGTGFALGLERLSTVVQDDNIDFRLPVETDRLKRMLILIMQDLDRSDSRYMPYLLNILLHYYETSVCQFRFISNIKFALNRYFDDFDFIAIIGNKELDSNTENFVKHDK